MLHIRCKSISQKTNGYPEGSISRRWPVHTRPSAVAAFDQLQAQIGPRRPVVFLDFDGTLTPIMPRPDMTSLSRSARAIVATLAERCPVAVVSGRDRADVKRLVGLPNLIYAGSHGFDVILPDGQVLKHEPAFDEQASLDRVFTILRYRLSCVPGSLIERKRFAVAVHSRNVPPEHIGVIQTAVHHVLKEECPRVKLIAGKMVYELQPNLDWDKGKAVLWVVEKLGEYNVVPVFFGDDVTDEHAFARLQGPGLGVVVASAADRGRLTAANFRVENPNEVMIVLQHLWESLQRKPGSLQEN